MLKLFSLIHYHILRINKGYLNKLEEISENSFLYGTQKTSTATKYMCVLEKYALMLSIETAIFKNQVVNNTILKTNYPNVELKAFCIFKAASH